MTSRGSCSACKLDDQKRGKGQGFKPPRTPSPPNRRRPSPHPEVSNRTGTSSQDETFDLLQQLQERDLRARNCDFCHPPFCMFTKREQAWNGPSSMSAKHDRAPSLKRSPKGDTLQGSSASQKQTKAGGNVLQKCRLFKGIIHSTENLGAQGAKRTTHTPNVRWSDYDMKLALFQEAAALDFDVLSKDCWHDTKRGHLAESFARSEELAKMCTVRTSSKTTLQQKKRQTHPRQHRS